MHTSIWISAKMKPLILPVAASKKGKEKKTLKFSSFQSIPTQLSTSQVFQSTEALFSLN